MPNPFPCLPGQTALLAVDLQRYFTEPGHAFTRLSERRVDGGVAGYFERLDTVVLPNLQALLQAFRRTECPIVYTQLGATHPDGRDLPAWARRLNAAGREAFGEPVFPSFEQAGAMIDPRIKPQAQDWIVRKTTTGALASSPFETQLRARGIRSVVVTGVLTPFCVAQTARELADRDFDVAIVDDATASLTPAAHEAALSAFAAIYGWLMATTDLLRMTRSWGG